MLHRQQCVRRSNSGWPGRISISAATDLFHIEKHCLQTASSRTLLCIHPLFRAQREGRAGFRYGPGAFACFQGTRLGFGIRRSYRFLRNSQWSLGSRLKPRTTQERPWGNGCRAEPRATAGGGQRRGCAVGDRVAGACGRVQQHWSGVGRFRRDAHQRPSGFPGPAPIWCLRPRAIH
jgi:hypothetical protein